MRTSYEQAKSDFLTLYEITELYDMVMIDDCMSEFMANPTKKYARGLYISCIQLWFAQERGNNYNDYAEVEEIANRHGEDL